MHTHSRALLKHRGGWEAEPVRSSGGGGEKGGCGREGKKDLIVEEEGYIKRQKGGEGTSGRKKR